MLAWFLLVSSVSAISPEEVKSLVLERASVHGADSRLLLCVILRENPSLDPTKRGLLGEYGLSQWLPGRGNAWDETSAWLVQGIDIAREYEAGNPDAVFFDVDGIAELFAKPRQVREWHWHSTIKFCR